MDELIILTDSQARFVRGYAARKGITTDEAVNLMLQSLLTAEPIPAEVSALLHESDTES